MIKPLFAFLICSVLYGCPFNAAAGLVISEFMADNSGIIADQDGASPDWIEIHNDSGAPANLAGWHLTDSAADLMRWTFPATNLPAGGYLIAFASGKNRAVAGAELHTNFQLGNGGDYLALVQPDGTVAHEFSPAYPPQRRNVSYGLEVQTSVTQLISTDATAGVLVPVNGTLGLTWTARTFDDASWLATNTPVSFVVGTVASPVLALDINERGQDAGATTQTGFLSFVIASNVSSSTIQTQATTRVLGGLTVTVSNTAPYGYDDRLRSTPTDSDAFTESLLLRDFIFSRDDTGTGGLDITISGLTANQPHRFTIWSFDSGSAGSRVSDWFANGVVVTNGYLFDGSVLPT
ncbi:MAG TPA: lamin tail domain-containing protein, partial [Verrucomicrobiae bacterium]|nr:lamin tail domain-containing protein [Verrucomicrobiae bacterium]